MTVMEGTVVGGCGHFGRRIANFPDAFRKATGEELFSGTLNVDVGRPIEVKEHFRIRGEELDEPEQDLKFEVCRINGIWAYRVRPYVLTTTEGGHGDHILEIACAQEIPNATLGSVVQIALFRDDIDLAKAGRPL
jgi:CTP-dependent riboflavin kinase